MDFLHEFGLYDIVGYFVPGALLLFVVILRFAPALIEAQLRPPKDTPKQGKASSLIVFVIAAYITGHMVQAIASPLHKHFFIDDKLVYKETTNFRPEFQERLKHTFGRRDFGPGEVRLLCEKYIRIKGVDSFYNTMDARFAFYRGLYVSLAISSIVILACIPGTTGERRKVYLSVLIALLVACYLSWKRCNDFEGYRAETLYRTFYIHSRLSETSKVAKQKQLAEQANHGVKVKGK